MCIEDTSGQDKKTQDKSGQDRISILHYRTKPYRIGQDKTGLNWTGTDMSRKQDRAGQYVI